MDRPDEWSHGVPINMKPEDEPDVIIRSNTNETGMAIFSPCEKYRYLLWRTWQLRLFSNDIERACCFLMLNPSTADHNVLDPTITRCVDHAKRWHFESLYVLNLFAWRATDPKDMKAAEEPIGKLNNTFISEMVERCRMTVVAYGNHASHKKRFEFVDSLPQDKLFYFKKNTTGHPKHPLYVAKRAGLFRWSNDEPVELDTIREL